MQRLCQTLLPGIREKSPCAGRWFTHLLREERLWGNERASLGNAAWCQTGALPVFLILSIKILSCYQEYLKYVDLKRPAARMSCIKKWKQNWLSCNNLFMFCLIWRLFGGKVQHFEKHAKSKKMNAPLRPHSHLNLTLLTLKGGTSQNESTSLEKHKPTISQLGISYQILVSCLLVSNCCNNCRLENHLLIKAHFQETQTIQVFKCKFSNTWISSGIIKHVNIV